MKNMKKLITLSVVAVSLHGAVCAEGDFRSVPNPVELSRDKELQYQAQKSFDQIVDAVNDFMLLATKKVADKSNQQDKARLKEILVQLDELMSMYRVSFEDSSPLDWKSEQEVAQRTQALFKQCVPLMTALDEGTEGKGLPIDRMFRVELFKAVKEMIAQIKSSL